MNQDSWSAVDDYITGHLVPLTPALEATLAANAAAGLPGIDVSPAQGKLLYLMARMTGARRVLEIGTLGGYSTIWLASAVPDDGHVVTLEAVPRHADIARENIARAGLMERVRIHVGAALKTLPTLGADKQPPFDLVFIDADKENNPAYFAWALRLTRPGATIIIDNVVRGGAIVDAGSKEPDVRGTRDLFKTLADEARVSATAIQTVGAKGWDGFIVAVVN